MQTAQSSKRSHFPLWLMGLGDVTFFGAGVWLVFDGTTRARLNLLVVALPFVLLLFNATGLYRPLGQGARSSLARASASAFGSAFLIWLIAVVADIGSQSSARELPLLSGAALTTVWRVAVRRLERRLQGNQTWALITTDGEGGAVDRLLRNKVMLHQDLDVSQTRSIRYDEWRDHRSTLLECHVIMLGSDLSLEQRGQILIEVMTWGSTVVIQPELYSMLLHGGEQQRVDDLAVVVIGDLAFSGFSRIIKRTVDLVVAGTAFILASPFLLMIGMLIRRGSPGPAIYRQVRIGRDGEPFEVLKFRTMVQDAEKLTGAVLASRDDDRITPIGRVLRSLRIDELPQLWNVIRGDMSIVGPRPERPEMTADFEREIPGYDLRHLVRPGITGLAQVSTNYSTTPQEKLRFDLVYMQQYSLWLDLRIMLQTAKVMVHREQAEGVGSQGSATEAEAGSGAESEPDAESSPVGSASGDSDVESDASDTEPGTGSGQLLGLLTESDVVPGGGRH